MEKVQTKRNARHRMITSAAHGAAMEVLEARRLMSTGTVTGAVYDDANGNGIKDAGEPGIANVTVFVDVNHTGTFASGDPTAITLSDGTYSIPSVPTGSYNVYEVVPPGYTQFAPSNNGGIPTTVTANGVVTGDNFANRVTGSPTPSNISGNIFNDANGNGKVDAGDVGLENTLVYLDLNHSGSYQSNDPVRRTDVNGNYSFNGLSPGTYTVSLLLPTGETVSTPKSPTTITLTLGPGNSAPAEDFGVANVPVAPTNTITGTVFNDLNQDGVHDNGEGGISGVTVYIDQFNTGYYISGDPIGVSDQNGNYAFGNLTPGDNYQVRVVLPSNYVQTYPLNNESLAATVPNSTVMGISGQDFGLIYQGAAQLPGTVGGTVYNDVNGNGVQDSGEAGVQNATVYVDVYDTGSYVSGDPTVLTNASGVYTITGVAPGSYYVRVIPPSGDSQDYPLFDQGLPINVTSGGTVSNQNFGLTVPVTPTATIAGTVFNDGNSDGLQDNGEAGIGGIQVFIDASNTGSYVSGDPVTATDVNGGYSFTGLAPGSYTILETIPAGDTQTTPASNAGYSVTVVGNQVLVGQNFGLTVPVVSTVGTITGTVFNDVNNDGVQDNSEPGVANVSVYVDVNHVGSYVSGDPLGVSNSNGVYTIANVAPGGATIREIIPAGYTQTTPASNGALSTIVTAGQISSGENFALANTSTQFGSITGNVSTTGSVAVPNVLVYVDLGNIGSYTSGDPNAITDTNGNFTIATVPTGTFNVREVVPSGDTQASPSANAGVVATVTANQITSNANFTVSTGVVTSEIASVGGATVAKPTSGTAILSFPVTLTKAAPAGGVTVFYQTVAGTASSGGGDYIGVASGSVFIPAGSTSGAINITVKSGVQSNTKNFSVFLSGASNASVGTNTATGSITANQTVSSVFASIQSTASITPASSGTSLLKLTVTLSAPAGSGGATINYATVAGTASAGSGDYVGTTGSSIFIAAGATTGTITIQVKAHKTGHNSFQVHLLSASGATLLSPTTTMVTIV